MEEKARQEAEAREREEEQRRREEEEEEALRRELLRLQELQHLRNAKRKKKEKAREVQSAEPVTQSPRLLKESARTALENLKNNKVHMERCILGARGEDHGGTALHRLLGLDGGTETAPARDLPGKNRARQPPVKKSAEVLKMAEPSLKTTSAAQTQTETGPPPAGDAGPEEAGGRLNGQNQPSLVQEERLLPVSEPQPEPEPVRMDPPPPADKAATSESPQPKTKTKKNKKKKGEKSNSIGERHGLGVGVTSISVFPFTRQSEPPGSQRTRKKSYSNTGLT